MRRTLLLLTLFLSGGLVAVAAERTWNEGSTEVSVRAALAAEVRLVRREESAPPAVAQTCGGVGCAKPASERATEQPRRRSDRASCDEVPPRTYVNSRGQTVRSPCWAPPGQPAPRGATARCRDGAYSFSRTRQGSCSGHRGVEDWL